MVRIISITGFVSYSLLFAVASCKTGSTSSEKATDLSRFASKGIATISWPCSGMGRELPAGSNSQEDYCEWNREPEKFTGVKESYDGESSSINLNKACIFTTSFDRSRRYFLAQQTLGSGFSKGSPYYATRFNTYETLAGTDSKSDLSSSKGLIKQCISSEVCSINRADCVKQRVSDSQVCRTLNSLGKRNCKLDMNFATAPVITSRPNLSGPNGDKITKLQLSIRSSVADKCWFVTDPTISPGLRNEKNQPYLASEQATLVACDASSIGTKSCDDFADDISVSLNLKISNPECAGGKSSETTKLSTGSYCKLKVATPAAAGPRKGAKTLFVAPPDTEVFIRAFIGDFVSTSVNLGGQIFGSGASRPVFFPTESIKASSCIIK